MTRRIALTGANGQVGRAVIRAAAAQGVTVVPLTREACNFADEPAAVRSALQAIPEIDGLIHTAAYTAVDRAETEPDLAFRINAEGPELCAEFCADRDIALVHLSTDYVFDGSERTPYAPHHPLSPINIYGQTKAIGELSVIDLDSRAAVLRTAWVFDGYGKNFFTTMMHLGATREQLNVVSDQIGRPTHTQTIAETALTVLQALAADETENEALRGVFHVTNSGDAISWAAFANAIFAASPDPRTQAVTVNPITTLDFGAAAPRPAYSVLDTQGLTETFGVQLPDWRDMVDAAHREFKQTQQEGHNHA